MNVIAYVATKNKTTAHIMNLNNRISCVVGMSTFGWMLEHRSHCAVVVADDDVNNKEAII